MISGKNTITIMQILILRHNTLLFTEKIEKSRNASRYLEKTKKEKGKIR